MATKKKYWGNDNDNEYLLNEDNEDRGGSESDANRIYFYTDVDRNSILQFNKQVRQLSDSSIARSIQRDSEKEKIELHINSFGGSLFDGFSGLDEIRKAKAPIHTIVDGYCASAATFLSICGDRRSINKHAYMLIHQLSAGSWGKFAELQDEMDNLNQLMKMIKDIYKTYTNIPMKKLDEILKHDLWLNAEECLQYGLVDEIL